MSLAWNPEKGLEAEQQGYFIYVPSGRKVYLSDAVAMWNDPETENIMFHTGYRIAGDIFDINRTLHANNIPEQTIGDVIQTSIDSENYLGNLAQIYQTTLAQDLIKRNKPQTTQQVITRPNIPIARPNISLTRPITQTVTRPITQQLTQATVKESRLQWSNIEIAKLTQKMQIYSNLLNYLDSTGPQENFELRIAVGEVRRELQADRSNCERSITVVRDEIQLIQLL